MRKSDSRRVIAPRNLPSRAPLVLTLIAWLFLDRFRAPGWVWGATGAFLLLLWIVWCYDVATALRIDVLSNRSRD